MNPKGGLFNWAAFRNPAYTVYCIAGTFCLLGLYTGKSYRPPCHAVRNEGWITWSTNSDDLPAYKRHFSRYDERICLLPRRYCKCFVWGRPTFCGLVR